MKTKLTLLTLVLARVAGCVSIGPPVVYCGWYGSYWGPYYWDDAQKKMVTGKPEGWTGHYHYVQPQAMID